jgi:hypothetical protein
MNKKVWKWRVATTNDQRFWKSFPSRTFSRRIGSQHCSQMPKISFKIYDKEGREINGGKVSCIR